MSVRCAKESSVRAFWATTTGEVPGVKRRVEALTDPPIDPDAGRGSRVV